MFNENKILPKIPKKFKNNLVLFSETIKKTSGFLKTLEVCLALAGDLIGVEACLEEKSESVFTYKANSQPTIFYYISRQELMKYFEPVLKIALEHTISRNLTRLKSVMFKLESILQLGRVYLLEYSTVNNDPVFLSGKSDNDKIRALVKNTVEIKEFDQGQHIPDDKMQSYLKMITGLKGKGANRNLSLKKYLD